jgi:hypothetical protein
VEVLAMFGLPSGGADCQLQQRSRKMHALVSAWAVRQEGSRLVSEGMGMR